MSDLVKRLRASVEVHRATGNAGLQRVKDVTAAADALTEQAATIDRLRAKATSSYVNGMKAAIYLTAKVEEIARLREALKTYQHVFCKGDCALDDKMTNPDCSGCIARAALNKEPTQ